MPVLPFIRLAAVALLASLPTLTFAQLGSGVPAGACLLPGGQWCWPSQPTPYGEPCQCPTPGGQATGVTQ